MLGEIEIAEIVVLVDQAGLRDGPRSESVQRPAC
jgi:hypothetical protein